MQLFLKKLQGYEKYPTEENRLLAQIWNFEANNGKRYPNICLTQIPKDFSIAPLVQELWPFSRPLLCPKMAKNGDFAFLTDMVFKTLYFDPQKVLEPDKNSFTTFRTWEID